MKKPLLGIALFGVAVAAQAEPRIRIENGLAVELPHFRMNWDIPYHLEGIPGSRCEPTSRDSHACSLKPSDNPGFFEGAELCTAEAGTATVDDGDGRTWPVIACGPFVDGVAYLPITGAAADTPVFLFRRDGQVIAYAHFEGEVWSVVDVFTEWLERH